jgi:hypothetical protein
MAKREKVVKIVGRVVNRTDGEGVVGLRVEAWDKDRICDDLVGSAMTGAGGAFRMEFGESYFKESFLDRQPDLFFKVFQGGRLIHSTEDSVLWNVEAGATEIVIEVGVSQEQPLEVKGAVRLSDGSPASGVAVSAFDRDLRFEQLLGQGQTDKDGSYKIQYFANLSGGREKESADLVVKATAADGALLVASRVLFNAPASAEVDLIIPADALQPPPLFEKIGRELAPLLGELKAGELEEDEQHQDLSFLSGETGFEKDVLARFVLAHKLARQGIDAEFWFALLSGSIFTFDEKRSLADQSETILDSLPSLDAAAARKSLTRSLERREISEASREKIDDWVEAFLQLAARRAVSQSAEPTFLKLALEDAGIKGVEEQEKFARLFAEHKELTPALLADLEKDDSFDGEAIADLRTTFQLAELTQADFSAVKMLKEGFGIRRPEEIRTLAKKSEREWLEVVSERHAAGEVKLPFEVSEVAAEVKLPEAEAYAKTLERQFREAFPTTAFAGGLERALQNGGARGLRQAETLSRFLGQHENFELLNTPVDEFLRSSLQPDFESLARDENFKLEVKALQRVFKLAPSFEAADALLADDIHSAQQVYRVGETEFVRRYGGREGFTADSARLAWNRAADTHAAALTVVADLKALEADALPLALRNGNQSLSTFPNWDKLFQTGDLCECEHCRSVLSPAAYFAELLMFLKDRKAVGANLTVKDVLFARRPDLGYIELNCENALTPLPYIDVVCEVLEDVIAEGANDRELVGVTNIPDDSAATKTAVADALAQQHGISLGTSFSLSQVVPLKFDRWVAHGDDATYLLKMKATANFFAEVLRNTKRSAAELRAYPQYVNPEAYDKLRQARYPIALPFDLFAEEVRAAMQKTNLQRWNLMRTLRGANAPNNPTDGDIAAEYFGISADAATAPFDEKSLILIADATEAGQRTVWGEPTDPAWLNTIGVVKNFLQKTGLEYNELLQLLDLKFINPGGDIAVHHLDASCDTAQKVIQVLDEAKLDRVHRFLRLWRKLRGWKMWELDLVVRHPGIGNDSLDETFLINLMRFVEVKKRLGTNASVEQVAALFGDLNTETRFTKLHEKREDALYQELFLNRRLINPPDPAFAIDPSTGDLQVGETITAHHPVVLAALGIREADLLLLKGLTKASTGAFYINNDDLTLAHLSFLWRHAWLFKVLKFNAEDWKLLLKIFDEDVPEFASPKDALDFLERVEHLKAAGFKPDELNWLLAADRSAKSALKEAAAARFLAALRKDLQTIRAENDPAQYGFLTDLPPTDEGQLNGLLSALLQKLNRTEAEANLFSAVLRGGVRLEASVQGLPASFTFPPDITTPPNHIPIEYDEPNSMLRFSGLMTPAQRTILLTDSTLSAVTNNPAYTNAIEELFQGSPAAVAKYAYTEIEVTLPGGLSLPVDRPSLPIRYDDFTDPTNPKLSFTGVMTDAERLALIAEGNPALVIEELFNLPRLAVKFYEPLFSAPLADLPPAVNFGAQLPADLAAKVNYDAEQRLLRFNGIMRQDERASLHALVPNLLPAEIAYHNAVNSLAAQPQTIVAPDERIWLTDGDLDATQPANDTLAKRLAKAATKALAYLSKTLASNLVVQQSSTQLGLTEALTRRLLTHYGVLTASTPPNLLAHLTGAFAATTGVIDYATLKTTFDAWFWASRASTILRKWKITLEELERLIVLTPAAQLLDFIELPLVDSLPVASIERFLRTVRLLRLRDSLPETEITLLEVLRKLDAGVYAAEAALDPPVTAEQLFAADVQRLNDDWHAADAEALVASLDLTFPADYLLAENWERLRRAFYYLDNLNAGGDTVKTFAAAAMEDHHARTLKELLRSKFGAESWLTLSAEIQDVLRERKRDALAAYLLTQPKPPDAPSGKWENTNDLYAYYLLDVEMSACQLTSRLVQASGSVQLFVQRCLMGLEPDVEVKADGASGDSAWRWWKWMRKYRVWEANRKVFLYPENWIEPELRKDRSQFFKDLENELLQNEINQSTVETAFTNYLEKLDGVAQLEVAGFYQEDDGDNAIVHVFGRTTGAEPHIYYYRRYDYHQWTPWEKVDLDIQGDYLIPAVIERRLFLFWPVFTEVPDETENSRNVPIPQSGASDAELKQTRKRLKLQMAVSEYRQVNGQGKWTPKRVSKDFDQSDTYEREIVRKNYRFYPVDRSEVDGRFVIKYEGFSEGFGVRGKELVSKAAMSGAFEIAGCKGVPELSSLRGFFTHAVRPEADSAGSDTAFLKWVELGSRRDNDNDLTLENQSAHPSEHHRPTPLLMQTPWIFKVTPPWHLSYMDKLWLDGLVGRGLDNNERFSVLTGSWLPFFYNDKKRTFFVLPSVAAGRDGEPHAPERGIRNYYPEIKKTVRQWEDYFKGQVQTWVKSFELAALNPDERRQIEQFLWQAFGEATSPPPYTDEQVRNLLERLLMRYFHFYLGALSLSSLQSRQFHFKNFYHPFVCDFARLIYNPLEGIPALMSRETQLKNSGFSFRQSYQPTPWVVAPPTEDFYPTEVVDFTPDGAYSSYNWELFFHVPLLIANSLSKNQRFEEARDWYHFIFNPIGLESAAPGGSVMSKYWITKPFFETTGSQYVQQRIDNILRMLAGDTSVPGFSAQSKQELEDQVLDWRTNPFEPHRIANYRTVAYQKTVVMKYLDNLIAWGDFLFRQDSMESLNEATQLYILAAEILGPRPKKMPPQAKPPVESFNELEREFDKFTNALVEVENLVPALSGNGTSAANPAPLPMLYFCIPHNDKMLGYWDTVADRLYKLRNCMNIEGVVRQLALFQPPIDPAALVKAVAGGVDIGAALSDLNAPLPLYRFNVLLQKANELCNDVKSLGGALLSALEKKDAEALGLLRQGQEIKLLDAVKAVREKQIEEAKENLEGVKRSKATTEVRRNFYRDVQKVSDWEKASMIAHGLGIVSEIVATVLNVVAGTAHLMPTIIIGASGFGGSPHVVVDYGGENVANSASKWAGVFGGLGGILHSGANLMATQASNERRWDDWKFQERLAEKELLQLDKQIAAAELRVAIAERELDNHLLQIENAKATDAFMRSKYTNEELYRWQVGQISGVFFQSYRLAYDLAKRAERCFRFELGLQDSSYINFGYWDSLKKGLLSGEKLQHDLRRLEVAHLDQNRREYELTKHVSLALLDPLALVKLRETGRCFVSLPEEIFDLDYPGHYFRRIKSVSLTLPCVVGPYTTISCTLRLLKNSIRVSTAEGDNGYRRNTDEQNLPSDDSRFVENNIPVKAIAASHAQNDSGVFELSFRDERYLPFEGAGAVSDWSLELFSDPPSNNPVPANPPDFGKPLRQFDYSTISDAVLHIKYTARGDTGPFKNAAVTHLRNYFQQANVPPSIPSLRLFDLRREFPTQWHRFLHPTDPTGQNILELEMSPSLFPIRDTEKTLKVNTIWLLARCTDKEHSYKVALAPPLTAPLTAPLLAGVNTMTLASSNQYGGLHFNQVSEPGIEIAPTDPPVTWQVRITRDNGGALLEDPVTKVMEVQDVMLVLGYEWK